MQALQGFEEALGPTHSSTLQTVYSPGKLYMSQGNLGEAGKMYIWALKGYEDAFGPKHTSTLDALHCFAILLALQGKEDEAEKMYMQAEAGLLSRCTTRSFPSSST